MNDFLTRIAQRSRSEARVVASRLPSLFAPPADYNILSATDTVKTTVQAADQAVCNEKIKQAPIANTVIEEAVQPVPPGERSTQQVQQQKIIKGYTNRREEIPPTVAAPQGNTSSEQHIAAPVSGIKQESSLIAQTASAESNGFSDFAESGHIQTNSSSLEKRQPIVPEHVEIPFDSIVERKDQSGTMIPQATLQLVPEHTVPYTTPQQTMAKLPSSKEIAGQQETTVHVNIGRVEVRAQSAAPVAAPRTVRSKEKNNLSLNAYLNRSGGRP